MKAALEVLQYLTSPQNQLNINISFIPYTFGNRQHGAVGVHTGCTRFDSPWWRVLCDILEVFFQYRYGLPCDTK